jgi:pyrroloquinoline quinone biosynthesis protein D
MAWQTIDGEMVLLDIDGNQLMGVNPVAARIWDLCDGERDLSAIAAVIADEYAVSASQAAEDVRAFVSELVSLGALEE